MELDFLMGTFRPENTGLPFLMYRCSPEIFHSIDTKIRVHLHPDRNSRNLLVQNECWWKAPIALRLLSNRILEAFFFNYKQLVLIFTLRIDR